MAEKKKKKSSKKVSFMELTEKELDKMYVDSKKELQELRFQIVTSSVRNVNKISHLKKEIARILTTKKIRATKAATG